MPQPPKELNPTGSLRERFGAHVRHWRGVRKLSQSELGAMVHISGNLIGKIEKGERLCRLPLARLLDAALRTGGILEWMCPFVEAEADKQRRDAYNKESTTLDHTGLPEAAMLSLDDASLCDNWADAENRAFLTTEGAAARETPSPFSRLLAPVEPARLPATVRLQDIEQILDAARVVSGWDNAYGGGGIVRQIATAQLKWAAALLECRCPERIRPELFAAAARLGMVVGAIDFDAYAHDDARRVFAFAAACAEEAGEWHLRAKIYSFRARQAIWLGDADTGLTHAELGLVRPERLTATEHAMLHTARARAYAKLGDIKAMFASIDEADAAFARRDPALDPAWMAYYDEAQHQGDTGHALYDVALTGRCQPAALERFRAAVDLHTDAYVRSRAMSRTKLAALTMAVGDPYEAVTVGNLALTDVGQMRSRRAAAGLRELAVLGARYRAVREVAELRSRIQEAVDA
ncbi:helix-turn-helix domain-containing protein [Streptomyces gamaensis]|uniref:Helix-turn-helix domain-containing protein n=1 Tax=Streptomyces gamaensis TaxID=1763542 RepID=A0ABW0YVK2_9ACTN